MNNRLIFLVCILMNIFPATALAQAGSENKLIEKLLRKQAPLFDSVLRHRKDWNVQILYSEINRKADGKVSFTDHRFNLDTGRYFYPASTVKLPVAILALQKLHELNRPGLTMHTTMITGADGDRQTEVCNDPNSPDGRPTIANYIKKILLVSDNDAYNRLYEFLGQEYINTTLHRMGYRNVQIIHRLDIALTEEENRHTNPVVFLDTAGKLVYFKPPERSAMTYANRNTRMGNGYMKNGTLVPEPFDFSKKNRITLPELHQLLKTIMYPEAVPARQRFLLDSADYALLRKYMSMYPGESVSPVYNRAEYPDAYCKFLYYGADKTPAEPGLRIFNKVGDAYGFLLDAACIVDYTNNRELLVTAVIYCNSNGIFNDDHYDYNTIGLPFMKNLGRMLVDYERTKIRSAHAAFSPHVFHYRE